MNALLTGTEVAIQRYPNSSECVVCLCGRMDGKNTSFTDLHLSEKDTKHLLLKNFESPFEY